MHQYPTSRVHYPALDILRGLAILTVVFFHNFDSVSVFRFGWMGVDLFFVLSGFLITDLLLSSLVDRHYFRNFFMRRALRILPLYYLVLLVFFTCSPWIFNQQGADSTYAFFNDNKLWFWTHFQNWLLVKDGPAPVPYLSHFWSLGVEEQFYLFWPFVLFIFREPSRLKKLIILLIVVAIVLRCFMWVSHPQYAEAYHCNTLTRMDSLLMGSLLAVHLKQGRKISQRLIKSIFICFVLLIMYSLFWKEDISQTNGLIATFGYTILAAFFACVIYVFIQPNNFLKNSLSNVTMLQFFGKISYGIYVFHLPIHLVLAFLLSAYANTFFHDEQIVKLLIAIISIGFTVAVSTASFYLLEQPLLQFKRHFRYSTK